MLPTFNPLSVSYLDGIAINVVPPTVYNKVKLHRHSKGRRVSDQATQTQPFPRQTEPKFDMVEVKAPTPEELEKMRADKTGQLLLVSGKARIVGREWGHQTAGPDVRESTCGPFAKNKGNNGEGWVYMLEEVDGKPWFPNKKLKRWYASEEDVIKWQTT